MIKEVFLVGIGGAFGSILRFVTPLMFSKVYDFQFPLVTFLVNFVGCLLIGIFTSMFILNPNMQSQSLKLLFIVGFCGGLTTFSTFSMENLNLIQQNQWGIFSMYSLLSVVLGIFAVWIGSKVI